MTILKKEGISPLVDLLSLNMPLNVVNLFEGLYRVQSCQYLHPANREFCTTIREIQYSINTIETQFPFQGDLQICSPEHGNSGNSLQNQGELSALGIKIRRTKMLQMRHYKNNSDILLENVWYLKKVFLSNNSCWKTTFIHTRWYSTNTQSNKPRENVINFGGHFLMN